jgi:hypothetical protein
MLIPAKTRLILSCMARKTTMSCKDRLGTNATKLDPRNRKERQRGFLTQKRPPEAQAADGARPNDQIGERDNIAAHGVPRPLTRLRQHALRQQNQHRHCLLQESNACPEPGLVNGSSSH